MAHVASYLFAVALAVQATQSLDDPRAKVGTLAFFNLCGGTVTGVESPIDPEQFKFTKLSPKTVEKIRPGSEGQTYWDVAGLHSKSHALLHIGTTGVCSLELVEASEASMRSTFLTHLEKFAENLGGKLDKSPDKVKDVEGKPMTSSEWQITTPNKTYLVGLTTYPDHRFMTQHIAMLKRLR